MEATGFAAREGEVCLIPEGDGSLAAVMFGQGKRDNPKRSPMLPGLLPTRLPAGRYHFASN